MNAPWKKQLLDAKVSYFASQSLITFNANTKVAAYQYVFLFWNKEGKLASTRLEAINVTAQVDMKKIKREFVKVLFIYTRSQNSDFLTHNYRIYSNWFIYSWYSDIDECLNPYVVCGVDSECQNSQGSYRCICKPGFKPRATSTTNDQNSIGKT